MVQVHCKMSGAQRCGPWCANLWHPKLALGTLNVTSQVGRELELVREVERYRLDIAGLSSTYSLHCNEFL